MVEIVGRKIRFAVIAIVTVALPVTLWAVSRTGVSPEQRLADAEPPPPATVDVELEERVLEDTVVIRGQVAVREAIEIGPPELAEAQPVIVDVPVGVGDELKAGDVAAVVADRPVIVLAMPVPLYRSLGPGAEGEDVKRLQQALADVGYQVPVDGELGPVTQAVVRGFYRDRGFEAMEVEVSPEPAPALDTESSSAPTEDGAGTAAGDGQVDAEATAAAPSEPSSANAATASVGERGVVVPLGEIIGLPTLPTVVSSVSGQPGEKTTEAPVLTVSSAEYVIEADVDPTLATLLTPGSEGVAGDEEWPVEVVGSRMDAGTDTESAESEGVPETSGTAVVVRPLEPLPTEMLGQSVRVEIVVEATGGPVLAAPVVAVRSNTDGEYIQVVGTDGTLTRVDVSLGASIGGWVELLEPSDDLGTGTVVRLG